MRGEACKSCVSYIVCARPVGDSIEIDLEDGGKIFPAVAEDDRLGNIGAGAQRILDQRWRNGLSARSDNEIPGTIDQPQVSIAPFTDVAVACPTSGPLNPAVAFVTRPTAT